MDEHRRIIISIVVLAVIMLLSGYFLFYLPIENNYNTINSHINYFKKLKSRSEVAAENRHINVKNSDTELQKNDTIEDFLRGINDVAFNADVVIYKMTQDRRWPNTFKLSVISDYHSFLKFIAEIEQINIYIRELSIHPYKMEAGLPLNVVTLLISVFRHDYSISAERFKRLNDYINKKELQDPFKNLDQYVPIIDLTWLHKLTSIGISAGTKEATIDRKVVRVGDFYPPGSNRRITMIEADRVYLSEKTIQGEKEYIIRFRKKRSLQ